MATLNQNDVNMTEAKSEETKQHPSGNTANSLGKKYKLKASLTPVGKLYNCKECGKQMTNQSSLNRHIRAIHEGIKYPCGECQYQATSKGYLAEHRRAVHEGIKYTCRQCQHEATTKGSLAQHRRAVHERISL